MISLAGLAAIFFWGLVTLGLGLVTFLHGGTGTKTCSVVGLVFFFLAVLMIFARQGHSHRPPGRVRGDDELHKRDGTTVNPQPTPAPDL
jgi:hypothetical protein